MSATNTKKTKSMDTAWSHRTFLHPNFCGDLHCTVFVYAHTNDSRAGYYDSGIILL